jgi:hypothetical protein
MMGWGRSARSQYDLAKSVSVTITAVNASNKVPVQSNAERFMFDSLCRKQFVSL